MKTKTATRSAVQSSSTTVTRSTRPFFQKHAKPPSRPSFFQRAARKQVVTSQPGDAAEREADAMADVVTGRDATSLEGGLSRHIGAAVQRRTEDQPNESAKHEEKEEAIQAQAEQQEEEIQAQAAEEEAIQTQAEEEEEIQAQGIEKQEAIQPQADDEEEEEIVQTQSEEEHEEEVQAQTEEEEEIQAQAEDEDEEEVVQAQAEDEEEEIQPRAAGPIPLVSAGVIHQRLRARRGMGSPLADNVRRQMEDAFAADFSGIRIHTDAPAVQLTRLLNAKAFATGRDVFFSQGRYTPHTRDGMHLLAHELTHTIQQGAVAATALQRENSPGLVQRTPEENEKILVRPELLDAIKIARGEIGKVNARRTADDGTRIGWQRLLEYFNTAFGKPEIHEQVIKYIKSAQFVVNGKTVTKDAMPSWCGIFVWWALKRAGVPIPDWKIGGSILKWVTPRGPKELPRKGDIAYKGPQFNDHFALVTGVEGPAAAAGKSRASILVATVNGNTVGEDVLGGQVQERWEPIGKWLAFFDPVGKLNMPPVQLVETSVEPDQYTADQAAADAVQTTDQAIKDTPTDVSNLSEEPVTSDPDIPAADDTDVAIELPAAVAPVDEPVAVVKQVDLRGSSDQALVGFTNASPSQMAVTQPVLGQKLDAKIKSEQQEEVSNAPVLVAKTSGEVHAGLTPPDQIPLPGDAQLGDGVSGGDAGDLVADPHENQGATPDNKRAEKLLDQKEQGGLLDWLKNNFKSFLANIRTKDPGLNTSAGDRPNVKLEGQADTQRMTTQRDDANTQLKSQRDTTTETLRNHPGQKNIQPKKINEARTAALTAESKVVIETTKDPGVADYAAVPLSADVRNKADELLKPNLDANLAEPRTAAEQSAAKRDQDKRSAITTAESETAKINAKADADQRATIIENRGKVADHQKQGIEDAYAEVNDFNKQADTEQTAARKEIGDKVKTEEGKARKELEAGEADAKKEKEEGERKAAAKKQQMEKEQKEQSWWDRTVGFVKKAVKAITSAIDAVFTAVRKAVKTIIEKAKNAAIGLINAARDWVVDKLNKFRDWAKNTVNRYLKDRFPGLAKRINGAIDAVVDTAIAGVNLAADAAIAGVEAVANTLAAALDKILEVFQTGLKAAVQIAGAVLTGDFKEALRVAIQAGCDIAGIDSKPIFDFIDRAASRVMEILQHPKKFFNNVMAAIGGGVRNFAKNIKKHLIGGLIGWLTGALSEVEITLPEKFDVRGIFTLAMQILGLTYENIKARVIKKFPAAARVFSAIEKGFAIVKRLVTEGPIALWDEVKQKLSNLKEMVLGGIRKFVITTVVKEAITWLLGLLNPAGALVKILKLIFDFVMFLVERFQQIKDFVMSAYNSVSAIASGALTKAMQSVEDALARSLPVVISLLASLAGLGGIGKTVKGIIGKVSRPVNRMIDALIDRVVKFAKKLLKKGKKTAKRIAAKFAKWWKAKTSFKAKDGATHSLFFRGSGGSAKLTVRSEEQAYTRFIEWANANATTQEQKTALAKAREIAAKIDAAVRKPLGKNLTDAQKEKASQDKQDEINKLLGQLRKHTGVLFGTDLPKWQKPTFGSTYQGFGTSMKAKVLTRNEMPAGSIPTQAKHATYDVLNKRRQQGGTASYYIRGHLLNDNLGGLGKWENMTPLSRSGNKQHEGQVESLVKAAVNSDAIMEYNVKPSYRKRGGTVALISQLKKGRPATEAADLAAIAKAEDFVPESLKCDAHRMEPKGDNAFKKVKSQSWTIVNAVDRTPSSYHLSSSEKIDPVRINSLTSAAPLKNAKLPRDLHNAADAIYAAVKARKDDPQKTEFGVYRTLAEEMTGDATQRESQLRQWNEAGYILL